MVDPEDGGRPTRFAYEQLSDLRVRWKGRPGAGGVRWLASRPGRRPVVREIDGLRHHLTAVPENALADVLDELRPDVVVGNSLVPLTWRLSREMCAARGIPTVLYVREEEAMDHFSAGPPADGIVANADSLARRINGRGMACEVIPSVIETGVTSVESTREVALSINPIESRGVDFVWALADRVPSVRFVLQESWPLGDGEMSRIEERARARSNVEVRRTEPPGPRLYRDARVLLAPYRIDNRPRVVAEAQANGIPVIGPDLPALVETIGDGGVIVPLDDVDAWTEAILELWEDDDRYAELCAAAQRHSERDAISPHVVAERFHRFVREVVDQRA